jgi:gamma-glutamylaminecyclotransferase
MVKIFVYGTLKRGFPLFERGLYDARFIGLVETAEPYPLVIAGSFFGPMMLDRPGEGLRVRGELFEIDADRLPVLDALEDVGKAGSFRTELRVVPLGGGLPVEALGFMKTESWIDPQHSGWIADYQDRRFIPPWER